MNNFRLIKKSIEVKHFLREISLYEDYWDTRRAERLEVQRETLNIPLIKENPSEGEIPEDTHKQKKTAFYDKFPHTINFLESVARELNSELSRVNIICLNPSGRVYPHTDDGKYYINRNRYHLVLQSRKGTEFISGDEKVIMKEGDLWWFDNKKLHEVKNLSDHPRVHIVFDLLPLPKQ